MLHLPKLNISFWLFACSFCLYMSLAPGNIPGDTEVRWSLSKSMALGHITVTDEVYDQMGTVKSGDSWYSLYGIGQSVLMLPIAAFAVTIESFSLVDSATADLIGQFLVSTLLFPLVGAIGVWLFFHILLQLGFAKKTSAIVTIIFAFATMHLHYSVNTQEASHILLLLLSSLYFLNKNIAQSNDKHVWLWPFCLSLGVCLLFRPASVVMVFPMYIAALSSSVLMSKKKDRLKIFQHYFLAGFFATGLCVCLCGYYNYARFGNIFETGYGISNVGLGDHSTFTLNIFPPILAILLSPGKSILVYNPVLIFSVLGLLKFWKTHQMIAIVMIAGIIGNVLFYSSFIAWAGDYSWSVRYQASLMGFLLLPAACFE